MGGNALKNTNTRRYNADEYNALVNEVVDKLPQYLWRIAVIPAYRSKESYGDMDVLIDTLVDVDEIRSIFNPNEVVKNGDVISFDYKEFQIDLIFSPEAEFNYALSYFSYNDLGNLIGKLAHKLGLKHGHSGLVLPIRNGENKFADILLTTDHDETLRFLGLDPEVFHEGFDNLTEIFEYVATSPYFDPESYKLENLNAVGRMRDKKRSTYNLFLKFCESYEGSRFVGNKDKTVYYEKIFDAFPVAKYEFATAVARVALLQLAATKFNGELVQEWTGLSGKDLGWFMRDLRQKFELSPEMVVTSSEDKIKSIVMDSFL